MPAHRPVTPSPIGPAILRLREEVGMSRERCAARAHLHRSNLRRIELGAGCTVATLQDIAAALRLPCCLIIGEAEGQGPALRPLFAAAIEEARAEEARDIASMKAPCIVRSRVA